MRVLRNIFWVICTKPEVHCYATHAIANWPKLTISAKNQTTEGLSKKIYLQISYDHMMLLIGFSKLQNLQIEEQKSIKQKLEIWKLKFAAKYS